MYASRVRCQGIDRDIVLLDLHLRILEEDVEGEDLVPKSFLEEEGEVECCYA